MPTYQHSLVSVVGRRLAAGPIPCHSHTRTRQSLTVTFLVVVAVHADRSLPSFPIGAVCVFASTADSWRRFAASRRFNISWRSSGSYFASTLLALLYASSACLPTYFLSELWLFSRLPVTYTGICVSCSTAASGRCTLFLLYIKLFSTPLRNRVPQLGSHLSFSLSVFSHVLISGIYKFSK